MAKVTRGEYKSDHPIFREGWSAHSAPPQPPLGPPPTDDGMAEQYSLQRQLERALLGVK